MHPYKLMFPALLLVACAHAPQNKPDSNAQTGAASNAQRQTGQSSCSQDADCGEKQICIRNQCVDISAGLAECRQVTIHFDLNASEIASSEKSELERSARCLKGDHALHVTIEGNADERGTEEYNLALGDRRATTVSKYLESLGASDAQVKTVSYGKEHPLCAEHDEACWAKNRRADLNVAQNKTPAAPRKKK